MFREFETISKRINLMMVVNTFFGFLFLCIFVLVGVAYIQTKNNDVVKYRIENEYKYLDDKEFNSIITKVCKEYNLGKKDFEKLRFVTEENELNMLIEEAGLRYIKNISKEKNNEKKIKQTSIGRR